MSQPTAGAANLDLGDEWLAFSTDWAALSSREQLFPLLQTSLRRLGLPGEPGLFILDDKRQHLEFFLAESIKKRLSPDDRSWLEEHRHPWPDGFLNLSLEKKAPTLLNLDEWMRKVVVPRHLRMLYDSGVRELFCAGIYSAGALIGGFLLQTANRQTWTKQEG
ncbi:MAG TPA: hypothetical protein VGM89_06505, partial [Puia sp.]